MNQIRTLYLSLHPHSPPVLVATVTHRLGGWRTSLGQMSLVWPFPISTIARWDYLPTLPLAVLTYHKAGSTSLALETLIPCTMLCLSPSSFQCQSVVMLLLDCRVISNSGMTLFPNLTGVSVMRTFQIQGDAKMADLNTSLASICSVSRIQTL